MAPHLDLVKLNHVNAITDGYADTVAHFRDRLGMQVNLELPAREASVAACLMTLGGVMYKFYAPDAGSEHDQRRLLERFGDHYIGAEYEVPDGAAARRVCAAHGMTIVTDFGKVFATDGENRLGISFELFEGGFVAPATTSTLQYVPVLPGSYWRDEHPLGITGLARLSLAVEDLDAAITTMHDLTGAEVVADVDRLAAGAVGAQLEVGDDVVELLAPTGKGAVATYLARYGPRIRSTVYRVTSLDRVEQHLSEQGFSTITGDAVDTLAIPPHQNKNLLFEFTE